MQILIAGGTGFIGQALTKHFLDKEQIVVILGRDKNKIAQIFGNTVQAVTWKELSDDPNKILQTTDFVINLTGANIAEKKWTANRKKEIVDSRVESTQLLANYCGALKNSPNLFNASGVGIYGLQPVTSSLPTPFAEDQPIDFATTTDFASDVAKKWEMATHSAIEKGVRVVNMRFAPVLGKGGLLKKMTLPYSLGLGGPLGSGIQPFPWIALEDLIRAIDFLILENQIKGPVNFVAPTCISQQQFAKALGNALQRPTILKTPAFLLKSIFGEMAETLLLQGQCAYPKVLLTHGFEFTYSNIDMALKHLYN